MNLAARIEAHEREQEALENLRLTPREPRDDETEDRTSRLRAELVKGRTK